MSEGDEEFEHKAGAALRPTATEWKFDQHVKAASKGCYGSPCRFDIIDDDVIINPIKVFNRLRCVPKRIAHFCLAALAASSFHCTMESMSSVV